jgi:hypothetical protein
MPWKAYSAMEERLRFIARLLDGEAMTDVCREFGIFRKTGYKILNCYNNEGCTALSDRSRRPVCYANQLPPQIEDHIVSLKRDKPHWGACKLRELLVRRQPGDLLVPPKASSTPCSTATASSPAWGGAVTAPKAPHFPPAPTPTTSGVPTSRANSGSAIAITAIPSPSQTTPHATGLNLTLGAHA